MSLTYQTYVEQLANFFPIASSDPNFQTFLPGCIDYAEQRIYRELDLLATRITVIYASGCSTSSRTISLSTTSTSYVNVVEELNILTPSGAISSATRNPVRFVTRQFIDSVYPSAVNGNATPQYAAMLTDTSVLLGPPPDLPYSFEVLGTNRPTELSSTNTSTWLTENLPDLFMAASMIWASGYMKDFGAQADTPGQSQSWEQQYKALFVSANMEEARKMYRSQGWTSAQPSQIPTPPRV